MKEPCISPLLTYYKPILSTLAVPEKKGFATFTNPKKTI
jgi:hypothetical protein